jgi:hypothetical protein
MANNLPDLCLQNIFNHLNDDLKSLYSCTLVNKQWSYSSIPVLWSNPFIYVFEEQKPLKSLIPLLDTYLSFLSKNQQEEFEIKSKFNQNSIMFNYPVYIRHIYLYFIYEGIKYWCNLLNIINERENQIFKALIESFFINSSKIDTLEIFESNDFNITEIFNSISNIQKIKKIHTLIINENSDISILLNLIQSIKSLIFYTHNFDLVDSLRQFVQSQENLTDITIFQPYQSRSSELFPTYWEIFHSSKTVTSTVTCIEFIHVQFPKNISLIYHLSLFTNLQYLKFRACDFGYIPNIKEDQIIQEINSNYPSAFKKLNTIIIEDSYLNLEILKILLQFSGEELLCLELIDIRIIKFNYIIKWLEVFCPNLRRLVIVDKTNDKLEIVRIHDFFRKFNNLSYVIINGKKHFAT